MIALKFTTKSFLCNCVIYKIKTNAMSTIQTLRFLKTISQTLRRNDYLKSKCIVLTFAGFKPFVKSVVFTTKIENLFGLMFWIFISKLFL